MSANIRPNTSSFNPSPVSGEPPKNIGSLKSVLLSLLDDCAVTPVVSVPFKVNVTVPTVFN